MDSEARGQVGGMESSEEVRKRLAANSRAWKCPMCQRSNEEVMKEVEEAVGDEGGGEGKGEQAPEELRLAYREDLEKKSEGEGKKDAPMAGEANAVPVPPTAPAQQHPELPPTTAKSVSCIQRQSHIEATQQRQQSPAQAPPAQQIQPQRLRQPRQPPAAAVPAWIDKAIYGIIGLLFFLVWKKLVV